MNKDNRPIVFLSYASEDVTAVGKIYQKLSQHSLKPWMDKEDIVGGEDWNVRILRAIHDADFFLLLLSKNSVNKRGVLQKEIKKALQLWEEKLDDDIYVIPVRLEECQVPQHISKFQWIDFFEPSGFEKLLSAIKEGLSRRESEENGKTSEIMPLVIEAVKLEEETESYRVVIEFPKLVGTLSPGQDTINHILSANAERSFRKAKKAFSEMSNEFPEAEVGSWYESFFNISLNTKELYSVQFGLSTYFGGAAHPNFEFGSSNFTVAPFGEIELEDLFVADSGYLNLLSAKCQLKLADEFVSDGSFASLEDVYEHFHSVPFDDVLTPKLENFESFYLSETAIHFLFSPYAVAAYALGPRTVRVSFEEIISVIDANGPLKYLLEDK